METDKNDIPYNFIADKLQIRRQIYNPNPKQKETSGCDRADCVIRALCKMSGKTWKQVFNTLSQISIRTCRIPLCKYVIEIFLQDYGWKALSEHYYKKKYQNIAMFMSDMKDSGMDFIILGGDHMCYYSQGVWYDNKYCFEFATSFLVCENFTVYMHDSGISKFIEYDKKSLAAMIKTEKTNGEKLEIAIDALKAISIRLSNGDDYMNSSMIDSIKTVDDALKMIGGI